MSSPGAHAARQPLVTALPKRVDSLKGEKSLTVVDAATLQVVRTYQFDEGVRPSAFIPDGRTMYTQLSHLNGYVEFDLSSGKIVRSRCRSATRVRPTAPMTIRRTLRTTASRCPVIRSS
jgi:hypothetical protein